MLIPVKPQMYKCARVCLFFQTEVVQFHFAIHNQTEIKCGTGLAGCLLAVMMRPLRMPSPWAEESPSPHGDDENSPHKAENSEMERAERVYTWLKY